MGTPLYTDDELIIKAIGAYSRFCYKSGMVTDLPFHSDSRIGTRFVHLFKGKKELAKYNIFTGEITRPRIKRRYE